MTRPDEDYTPEERLDRNNRDAESPTADWVEQSTNADPTDDDQPPPTRVDRDVDEGDAVEQFRIVPTSTDDEHR
jgi:hypothetical protein